MNRTVVVYMLDGEPRRLDLSGTVDLEYTTPEHTGVKTLGAYLMPRAGRIIIKTDSIWERRDRPGHTVGTRYHEADLWEIANIARDTKNPTVMALLPELTDDGGEDNET